ncbi:hypothetical protein FDP41_009215 [Naegleria fowleri]|uniref:Uncharacterized protein n=1 Tax=Naegleria fowleri TaxID=5763 RepID=A0A6A5BBH7_NAEFO|nr:uncharacterized protein FDP41_009215 [Naegleria fowleri]KAF0972312.1 hypothetical protein FDP41_009215 [Naegleria fowleri]CAG4709080.1 unnamed protein product [Naegleria fowleri]
MFCFLAGVASGVYLYKNYDVDRMIADLKPKFASDHKDSVWQRMKSFEQKYRKENVLSSSSTTNTTTSTTSTTSSSNDSSSK